MSDVFVATEAGIERPGGAGPELPGEAVVSIAAEQSRLWTITRNGTIRRSEDGEWEPVATLEGFAGRCLLPVEEGLLVGTSEARLFRLVRDALQPDDAFDEAPGRAGWYTPWGGPPDTRSLSQSAGGTVFANVHVGGILRRRTDGAWEPTIDIDADVHQVLAHPTDPQTVVAACAYGLATSTDGGDSWSIGDDGLHGSYCRAVAVAGETVLVSASTGPSSTRAAVYRRPIGGAGSFEKCEAGLPEWFGANIDSHCLTANGPRAAFGTADGEVWVSGDQGRTWERLAEGLAQVTALVLPR